MTAAAERRIAIPYRQFTLSSETGLQRQVTDIHERGTLFELTAGSLRSAHEAGKLFLAEPEGLYLGPVELHETDDEGNEVVNKISWTHFHIAPPSPMYDRLQLNHFTESLPHVVSGQSGDIPPEAKALVEYTPSHVVPVKSLRSPYGITFPVIRPQPELLGTIFQTRLTKFDFSPDRSGRALEVFQDDIDVADSDEKTTWHAIHDVQITVFPSPAYATLMSTLEQYLTFGTVVGGEHFLDVISNKQIDDIKKAREEAGKKGYLGATDETRPENSKWLSKILGLKQHVGPADGYPRRPILQAINQEF